MLWLPLMDASVTLLLLSMLMLLSLKFGGVVDLVLSRRAAIVRWVASSAA